MFMSGSMPYSRHVVVVAGTTVVNGATPESHRRYGGAVVWLSTLMSIGDDVMLPIVPPVTPVVATYTLDTPCPRPVANGSAVYLHNNNLRKHSDAPVAKARTTV